MTTIKKYSNTTTKYKSGFVSIFGLPNSGKSSLFNYLLNTKLAIVSHLPQTTRSSILGIIQQKDCQIILTDTPGVLKPKQKLQKFIKKSLDNSLKEYDLALYIFSVLKKDLTEEISFIQENLDISKTLFFVNKMDKVKELELKKFLSIIASFFPPIKIFPISVLKKSIPPEKLISLLKKYLPEHDPYYDDNFITDKSERFLVAEIIREKIFLHTKDEVPYHTACIIDSFKDKGKIVEIFATIIVHSTSHKMILLGKKGKMIKEICTSARKNIETLLSKKVFLDSHIKVRKGWVNNPLLLKEYGYH